MFIKKEEEGNWITTIFKLNVIKPSGMKNDRNKSFTYFCCSSQSIDLNSDIKELNENEKIPHIKRHTHTHHFIKHALNGMNEKVYATKYWMANFSMNVLFKSIEENRVPVPSMRFKCTK